MRARMLAMINKLMPLPMPYSSICSPSHIRKMVPAVIVSTEMRYQLNGRLPSTKKVGMDHRRSFGGSPTRNRT